ncbi:AAA family ATPase [Aromatoleum toluvorans]|uniref:AAA family ATPase n=1 Tax=Aromatoleum toluvorans TaxID=92002 RepID=A0ABX1PTV2_9RHOO|nr:TniB family NTP-binding protein [Aromatoleum toluvorans]NMG42640.1 AAA family ATPase [Aromatoleum toluvorans]
MTRPKRVTVSSRLQGFSIRQTVIEHPAFQEALLRVERLHLKSKNSGQAGGLLITGLTGSGKTTVRKEYERRYPVQDNGEILKIPVLNVDTPAPPTVKNLAEAILIAMGDPISHKGTAAQKTERIYRLLRICGVELLIIDEFQHFFDHGKRTEAARVTDWLKNLINNAGIPVVLMGMPDSARVLRLNPQLARRFSARFDLGPFRFTTVDEILRFRGLLSAIESALPLPSIPISTPEMAQRFHCASFGLIDYVCKITDGAVDAARYHGCAHIDQHHLAEAFEEEVWRDASPGLNPFSASSDLRPLTRPGEPFADLLASLGRDPEGRSNRQSDDGGIR